MRNPFQHIGLVADKYKKLEELITYLGTICLVARKIYLKKVSTFWTVYLFSFMAGKKKKKNPYEKK